jgi:hypothetical protein
VVDDLLRQIRAHSAPGAFGPRRLPPASFGAGGALCVGRAWGLAEIWLGVGAAFGFASERLLLQPGQLSLESPDLLEQPAHQNLQLDDELLGRLSFFFQARFALQRPRVLGAVIMSRLPITPPARGQICGSDSRVLADRNHPTRVTSETKCAPHKIEENYGRGGIAESLHSSLTPPFFDFSVFSIKTCRSRWQPPARRFRGLARNWP